MSGLLTPSLRVELQPNDIPGLRHKPPSPNLSTDGRSHIDRVVPISVGDPGKQRCKVVSRFLDRLDDDPACLLPHIHRLIQMQPSGFQN